MAMKLYIGKYLPYAVFTLLAMAVLLPLLTPGFILTLDMVFTPHIHMPVQVTSSYLFYALMHMLNLAIPADVLQKVILISIVFLSGVGGYKLVEHVAGPDDGIKPGAYVAGILYAVNPYTYARSMAGQFAVLLGYCLLPFVTILLLAQSELPSWWRGLSLGLLLTVIGILSIHTLGLVAILIITISCTSVWNHRHKPEQLKRYLASLMLALAVFVALSAYWLVPTLTGQNVTAAAIAGFTTGDNQAFTTLGNGFVGEMLHIIRLQGFWAENTHTFALPQTSLPGWWICICALWTFVGIGAVAAWRNGRRQIVTIFASAAFIGAVLATGTLNPLIEHLIPLFSGFREPQKFTGLVALAYVVFAGLGINASLEYLSRKSFVTLQQITLAAALLLPIVLTPTMFWGFGRQLQPVQYPATWASINNQLNDDKTKYQVLFLPWHLYMYYRFADRIIMSPAAAYFDKQTIASNFPEIGHASPDRPDPRKTLLNDAILPIASERTNIGSRLASLHIKYIILDKDNDFQSYAYLGRQPDLRLISENADLKLYINSAFRG